MGESGSVSAAAFMSGGNGYTRTGDTPPVSSAGMPASGVSIACVFGE